MWEKLISLVLIIFVKIPKFFCSPPSTLISSVHRSQFHLSSTISSIFLFRWHFLTLLLWINAKYWKIRIINKIYNFSRFFTVQFKIYCCDCAMRVFSFVIFGNCDLCLCYFININYIKYTLFVILSQTCFIYCFRQFNPKIF